MKRQQHDTASKWNPPAHIVPIAEERTAAIRRAFLDEARWQPADFRILAQSCYIQGLNDMADAAVKNGWIPPNADTPQVDRPLSLGDLP